MSKNENEENVKYFINHEVLNETEYSLPENFSDIFSIMKKKLHVKKSRKTQVDCLLKKAKCKFLQTVQEILKFSLKYPLRKRLPQNFVTNITYEYNQKYLDKKLLHILEEFEIIVPPDEEKIKIKNEELFNEFVGRTFSSLYKEYINSNKYKKDLNEIKEKSGKNLCLLYEFVSKNLIEYYLYNKQN